MVTYLVHHNFIMKEAKRYFKQLFLSCCDEAKARGRELLCCLPSLSRNSGIKQTVKMTFRKITASQFAREEKEGERNTRRRD